MNEAIAWLEAHEKLAGWAQFLGATIALAVTWWLARGEARARRINLTNRLKSTMLLVFLMHEGVKETLADLKAGNRPDITAAMQSDNNDLFAAEFHSFDQVTSTFMANNHIALIGWTATLRRLYSGIQTGTQTCQSASKRDPLSACNRDPLLGFVMDVTSAPLARVGA